LGKYTETFLEIKKYNRLIFIGYQLVYVASILVLILLFLIPSALSICYPAANAIGFVVLILIISSLVSVYKNTKKIDGFFTTGIFFLVLGFVIFILNNFSLITNSFLTENSPKFGTGLEIIFLSLSMSNLIKNLKDERESLQEIALQKSEEMNELKLYFLSNISHELRTPLNIILNLMEKISSMSKKKNIKKDCEIVVSSTQNLLSAVNDILDFSKIEKNEFALESASFNLKPLLDDIAKNYSYLAESYVLNFEFETNITNDFFIIGDRDRFRQVLNNLLNNAIKFTPNGSVVFKLFSVQKNNDLIDLEVFISDTGIGISKQKIESIFSAFSQETIDNKRKYGGLGLGLFIVKKIVDIGQGSIMIESEINQGTICKVKMPFVKVIQQNTELVFEDLSQHFKNKSILVVEDNLLNQLVLKKILKEFDEINITFANNGLECLDKLKTQVFDLILMDLQMPEMDGYEASTSIRNGDLGEDLKNIPIIAVTADVMESTKARVFEIGINSYISKPIEKKLLFNQMYKLI
jgi:signal transduction histidine kinase/ActR/RegA family two-component response regulator